MVAVAFAAVSKAYGADHALVSFTLDVDDGTICCLVGPSGSGKSTALRILAGLERPDDGELRLGRRRVNDVPTRDRDVGFVAQRDALLVGRRSGDSVALPLTFRSRPLDEIDARIRADAAALTVAGLLDRRPEQLSTGERRALQVARAMVGRPSVLLLDEPLANLDPARRLRVRTELVALQRNQGVTTLWATADHADAMAVSDRIAVLVSGRLAQVGPPLEVYDRPRSVEVARLLGEPEITIVPAHVRGVAGDLWYELGDVRLRCRAPAVAAHAGRSVLVGVRPHDVGGEPGGDAVVVDGSVTGTELHGNRAVVEVALPGAVRLRWDGAPIGTRPGDRRALAIDPARFHVFDALTGVAVHHPE